MSTSILKIETNHPDLRDKTVTITVDQISMGKVKPRIEQFAPKVAYATPLDAMAKGWQLKGPPIKHFAGHFYEWWFESTIPITPRIE